MSFFSPHELGKAIAPKPEELKPFFSEAPPSQNEALSQDAPPIEEDLTETMDLPTKKDIKCDEDELLADLIRNHPNNIKKSAAEKASIH